MDILEAQKYSSSRISKSVTFVKAQRTKHMGGSMTDLYKRILQKKKEAGLTWDEISHQAHVRLGTWMTGLPTSKPTDEEIKRMAPVLNTTYEYLKYGK